eukprot:XP_001708894.1 Hypothetical protein GL50803_134378 [Giardia lamblia ATCC 50803]
MHALGRPKGLEVRLSLPVAPRDITNKGLLLKTSLGLIGSNGLGRFLGTGNSTVKDGIKFHVLQCGAGLLGMEAPYFVQWIGNVASDAGLGVRVEICLSMADKVDVLDRHLFWLSTATKCSELRICLFLRRTYTRVEPTEASEDVTVGTGLAPLLLP